jgi:beta-lactamase regulating signal transducer with metallopeptidase domain
MMLEVVFRAALCALLLALVVQLGLSTFRVRQAQLLLSVWTAVLLASVAMPVLQRVIPRTIPVSLSRSVSFDRVIETAKPATASRLKAPVSSMTVTSAKISSDNVTPGRPVALSNSPPPVASASRAFDWKAWVTEVYLSVAAVLLFRLLLGLGLSWKLLRSAHPVVDDWVACGPIPKSGRIRTSARVSAPVTIGFTVLLPIECVNWDARRMQAVLAHEASHVARGDFYIQLLSQLNRLVFWFSPLSWWLHARLTSLAELASDDAAVEAVGDRPAYASILLEVARLAEVAQFARANAMSVAMARPSLVCQRIERILSEQAAPRRVGRFRQVMMAVGVAPVAMLAAVLLAEADPAAPSNEPHTRITIDPKLLDSYAGFYRNAATGSLMIVTREADHLLTHRAGNQPVPEYPYTDHDFFLTIVPQQNSFVTDAAGAVVRLVHHQKGRDEVLERISAEAAELEESARLKRLSDERTPRTAITIDPHLLDGYVGAYQLKPLLVFTVTRDGDRLFAKLTGQQIYEVHPYTDHDFFYTIVAAQLSFLSGPDGKASALVLHQNGKDQTAPRVDLGVAEELDKRRAEQSAPHTAIKIDPKLLDGYIGRYSNADMEMTATREGEQLYFQVTGYGRYPVYPYTEHDFFATVASLQFTFTTDDTGKVTQLVRHQRSTDVLLKREE